MDKAFEIALKNWDKKSAQDITEIYNRFSDEQSLTLMLIAMLDKPDCQMAASWLLKHHFESTNNQSIDVSIKIYNKVAELIDWQSRLVMLQSMPYLPIPEQSVIKVEAFIRDCLTDLNKFVRAWAYNGFYLLAKQYPSYQTEALDFLNLGLTDEPASVKVRIKKCIEKGFP